MRKINLAFQFESKSRVCMVPRGSLIGGQNGSEEKSEEESHQEESEEEVSQRELTPSLVKSSTSFT